MGLTRASIAFLFLAVTNPGFAAGPVTQLKPSTGTWKPSGSTESIQIARLTIRSSPSGVGSWRLKSEPQSRRNIWGYGVPLVAGRKYSIVFEPVKGYSTPAPLETRLDRDLEISVEYKATSAAKPAK